MRFALLCDDLSVRPLIAALDARVDGHELLRAVRSSTPTGLPLSDGKSAALVSGWVDLLVAKDIDAVIVGGSGEQIVEGAKQLATAGIPVLFAPQAAQGSTFVYELSLIRDDNKVPLYPIFWHRFDSAVAALKSDIDSGRFGKIQVLQLTRGTKSNLVGAVIPQADVDGQLLDDVDLLRWLVGDYDQVTALRTAATDEGVLAENVVLAGRTFPEANWSISADTSQVTWKLVVRGENGVAELTRDLDSPTWAYTNSGQNVVGDVQATSQDLLRAFAEAVVRDRSSSDTTGKSLGTEWGELVKCFETVDATHRSVRRRRTIELYFEPMSERAIFKTQMTAIGCGLLVATLFFMLIYLGIASIIPLPEWVLIILRTLVFGPLVVFLVAQLLLPITRPSTDERT